MGEGRPELALSGYAKRNLRTQQRAQRTTEHKCSPRCYLPWAGVARFALEGKWILRFDGAGNLGQCSYGVVVEHGGVVVRSYGQAIGYGTCNEAEYRGLIACLEEAQQIGEPVEILGDSQLVIKQMKGQWRCKAANLKPLHEEAKRLAKPLNVTFKWVPRLQNELADSLAAEAALSSLA